MGFSASNGRGSAVHLVGGWQIQNLWTPPFSNANGDSCRRRCCFMCSSPGELGGQNSNSNYHHIDKRVGELALGLGGLAAFIISLSAIVVIVIWCMTRKKRLYSRGSNEGQIQRFQGNKLPRRLPLAAIKSATKGFNHNRIIGEGGSATVYEGRLPSCGPVAVKRFSQVSQMGTFRNQFATEFATMMGCLRHKHLVQLQGWCCEGDELVLVYEYMPNGSLDKILHRNKRAMTFLLTWDRRVNIVLGVASALIYLHEECERQIIHRDVKTCNIMLDDELNAKLGDFGLAEVYEHSCMTRDATIPAGTMGYLAPEYVYLGVPSVKTDVYSFGVVVLEVASGKKPVNEEGTLLADYMWELWGKGKLMEAADLKLRGKFNKLGMERMLMVGLCCVHPDYEKRPMVREAARMIRGEAPLPVLPARKPAVSIRSVFPGGSGEFTNSVGDESLNCDDTPWLTPKTHF